jgi:putative heme iron utilization protein
MIGRIRTQVLLYRMMAHPESMAVLTDGERFRTDLDDVRENGYVLLLGASSFLF